MQTCQAASSSSVDKSYIRSKEILQQVNEALAIKHKTRNHSISMGSPSLTYHGTLNSTYMSNASQRMLRFVKYRKKAPMNLFESIFEELCSWGSRDLLGDMTQIMMDAFKPLLRDATVRAVCVRIINEWKQMKNEPFLINLASSLLQDSEFFLLHSDTQKRYL
jgi:hypothetical protein